MSSRAALDEIEQRRSEARISQAQLCRAANVHATTYHKLMRGQTKRPQWRTVTRLRRALDALIDEARQ